MIGKIIRIGIMKPGGHHWLRFKIPVNPLDEAVVPFKQSGAGAQAGALAVEVEVAEAEAVEGSQDLLKNQQLSGCNLENLSTNAVGSFAPTGHAGATRSTTTPGGGGGTTGAASSTTGGSATAGGTGAC
ncbi:hypothetical protein Taro_044361 [Colocasia esculenta]|uniref:Uncharacterized protein n=1 Tax=Colocasia esculenta TaxID=4460 RepID=A0A843X367_COLES|nr:hypothetical protein [Colocasia esculenta]